ncbi:hypothetical protein JOC75_004005 [Metabacillus crassostreae]|uniref:hypothetical protein n=1 Tax=Metabacillus crassostreae TaxID=929098 RepID=UPI00195D9171|nr:hypothetical protein [Metabacillus crassostreae]MBM7605977.1 hypothetical protein [Metabacillus crassostreae]
MIQAYKYDESFNYVEPVSLDIDDEIPKNVTLKSWEGKRLFSPKFDEELDEWIEGLSPEEVQLCLIEIEKQQNVTGPEEMNAMAIMELTNLILGGNGVE